MKIVVAFFLRFILGFDGNEWVGLLSVCDIFLSFRCSQEQGKYDSSHGCHIEMMSQRLFSSLKSLLHEFSYWSLKAKYFQ